MSLLSWLSDCKFLCVTIAESHLDQDFIVNVLYACFDSVGDKGGVRAAVWDPSRRPVHGLLQQGDGGICTAPWRP
jgi:hypothetical protein